MSNREALLTAVDRVIETNLAAGSVINADEVAIQLSSRFPQSGLPLDKIAQIVAEAAAARGAAVLTGSG